MKVLVGGTFDKIHAGHEALINKAIEMGGELFVAITSDNLASKKGHEVRKFEDRIKDVEEYCKSKGASPKFIALMTPMDFIPGMDVIIASPETERACWELNYAAINLGYPPMKIEVVPFVMAYDGERISSTRIRKGEINLRGEKI